LLDVATAKDPRMATWRTDCRPGAKAGAGSRALEVEALFFLEVEALGAVKSEKLQGEDKHWRSCSQRSKRRRTRPPGGVTVTAVMVI
jgi:hypothetical protein